MQSPAGKAGGREQVDRDVTPDDGALILYTSGTTGRPKGALHTHGSSFAWCEISIASFENRFGDRQLLVAPLFHIAGICLLFNAVHRGFTLVIAPAFDPGQAWDLIEREQITSMFAVPTMINMMREHEGRLTRSHVTLRWIMCGAAPVPVTLIDVYADLGIDIHQVYGSTETHGGIAVLPPAFAHSRKGSTGLAMFGVEIRAVDGNGDDVAAGERGELISRGPHIFQGYWGKPDATRDAFFGDWFRLGDIGVIDQDGFITILDRAKDMIISGGENIYPAEVEDVLMRHPDLLEVAVVGEADDRWGERVVAFVVNRPDVDGEKLVQGLTDLAAERLGAFKRPKRYEPIEALPRNAAGKVVKHVLRDQLAAKRN
jgi:acyl-CoA synthetase (AMP-forming)/AMP-acid ligase II